METMVVVLVVLLAIAICVAGYFAKKARDYVGPTVRRSLMNLELETKIEGFRAMYTDLLRIDFEGAVLIHNSTLDKWYCHASEHVFRDAMRIFNGELGPRQISKDLRSGAKFSIRAVKLSISGFPSCDRLRYALETTYAEEKTKY